MNSEGWKYKRRKKKVAGREGSREGQKGKLVHAMIMVVHHKSHNLLQRKSQHSKTKWHSKNPSHQNTRGTNAAVIPVHSKHTNHHGSNIFIYRKWWGGQRTHQQKCSCWLEVEEMHNRHQVSQRLIRIWGMITEHNGNILHLLGILRMPVLYTVSSRFRLYDVQMNKIIFQVVRHKHVLWSVPYKLTQRQVNQIKRYCYYR